MRLCLGFKCLGCKWFGCLGLCFKWFYGSQKRSFRSYSSEETGVVAGENPASSLTVLPRPAFLLLHTSNRLIPPEDFGWTRTHETSRVTTSVDREPPEEIYLQIHGTTLVAEEPLTTSRRVKTSRNFTPTAPVRHQFIYIRHSAHT